MFSRPTGRRKWRARTNSRQLRPLRILALIWRALKPAGYFYASFKTGAAEGRDSLDRYYNYPSPDWLRAAYAKAGGWSSLSIETGEVRGFDGKSAEMLFVVARKNL